jgi:hypothetical protein
MDSRSEHPDLKGGDSMNCTRCEGLMVMDRFEDLQDDTGEIRFKAWHCLLCGEIQDHVIASNRRQHPRPLGKRNRNLLIYN